MREIDTWLGGSLWPWHLWGFVSVELLQHGMRGSLSVLVAKAVVTEKAKNHRGEGVVWLPSILLGKPPPPEKT